MAKKQYSTKNKITKKEGGQKGSESGRGVIERERVREEKKRKK